MTKSDHDILIKMEVDIKYIRKFVATNKKSVVYLKKQNQKRKDWQEDFDSKTKVFLATASFIGGILVFVIDKVWDFFKTRKA